MRKFLKVSLKFQWKTILVIFALIVIQTFFQMEIIDLFGAALTGVKEQNIELLVKSGSYMLMYTGISVIAIMSFPISQQEWLQMLHILSVRKYFIY